MNNKNSQDTLTAQVTSVHKNKFLLSVNENEVTGILKGSYFQHNNEPPVVGDYVTYRHNPYGDSMIEGILPRKTVFLRPDRGGHGEGYVKNLKTEALVSNFDYVFIISSLNQNFNENRIARYIAITNDSGAKPVVILTKADLCDSMEVELKTQIIYALSDTVEVFAVSSLTGEGIDALEKFLICGNTIALIGSSGVGKSTLLNVISGQNLMKTSEIREDDGKGRHTTTHRELFTLPCGAKIIDTPGLREIGLNDVEYGIDETFSDITSLFSQCKFRNCSHTVEPGCAVLKALEDGSLDEQRWNLYKGLQEENTWGKEKMISIAKFNKEQKKYNPKFQR